MKKALLILACLLLLVSCSEKNENLCYYGYFSDSAVMVAYNAKKNTVYDITLPLPYIVTWGLENGIENIPNAIRSFTGAQENAFMMGSSDTLKSLKTINSALKENATTLQNQNLLNNINKLCSADFSKLSQYIDEKTVFEKIDAGSFTGSQSYFKDWIRQIYGE